MICLSRDNILNQLFYIKEIHGHIRNLGIIASLVVALCFSNIALASGTWYIQDSGITESLRDVCFVDSLNGCVCGDEIILHTSDGGRTWQCQWQNTSPVPTQLLTIAFRNRLEGWAGGLWLHSCYGAILLHTTDGGYSWNGLLACGKGTPPTTSIITDIDFADPFHGFYARFYDDFWSWDSSIYQLPTKTYLIGWHGISINKICFPKALCGWVLTTLSSCRGFDVLSLVFPIRLTDGGIEVPVERFFTITLHDIDFVDTLQGWIVGEEGTIFYTTNGGFTWTSQMSGIANTFYAVDFVDSLNGWVVGAGGSILRTRNGGDSWIIEPSPTNADLYAVCFVDTNHGWAVGSDGTIVCYTTGAVGIEEARTMLPSIFELYTYPNPINVESQINFTLPIETHVSLKIYDVTGRLVKILVDEIRNAGYHLIKWEVTNVPSGVYFCKFATCEHTKTKKLILLR
jgi:hypothetical protein